MISERPCKGIKLQFGRIEDIQGRGFMGNSNLDDCFQEEGLWSKKGRERLH
jgi:hypothetical protein